jgi:predicted lipoprotein with Yx(FWY)xxD motif
MQMNTQTKLLTSALGLSALLVLAACGSSAKVTAAPGSTTTATAATTPTTAMKVESSQPIVKTASSKLGSLLVDGQGMTLYTLTNAGAQVPCTGQCASFWPPLLLPTGTVTAMGATGVTGLGTAAASGGMQVTVNGAPVYRFSLDKKAGDTNGEGISSFGGTWHVVMEAGTTAATTPPTVAPAATSPPSTPPTTSYDYGY